MTERSFISRVQVGAVVLALCIATVLSPRIVRADDAAPPGRLDLVPYRVVVRATFAADPSVTPALRRNVLSALAARIGQSFGATWTLLPADHPTITEDDDLTPPDERGLERLTSPAVAARIGTIPCEKAYLLAIRPLGSNWLIAGREWDRTVQSLGPVLTATTADRRAIAETALELLTRLYSPVLIVNDADRDSKNVALTVRAGSIPPGDPRASPLVKRALLLPYFRFLDSKGNVRKIQPVPWTYLVLDEIKDGRAKCTTASSYRAPLAANMRRRVEAVALFVRPSLPETRLSLVVGKAAPRPLAGMFVDVQPMNSDQTEKGAGTAQRQELLSDRRGAVIVPADSRRPLRLLEVRSGTVILARRPFVPGIESDVTLELVDDEMRLNAQRDVDLLRIQLIETVARRAALIGRTRAASKTADAANARVFLADLDHLPNAEFYLAKLNEIRVVALEEATRRKDRVSERRIEELCTKTRGLIEQYLPEERLQTLKDEVAVSLADAKANAEAVKESRPTFNLMLTPKSKPNSEAAPQKSNTKPVAKPAAKEEPRPKPQAEPVAAPKTPSGL
jgi:hypothetical protein